MLAFSINFESTDERLNTDAKVLGKEREEAGWHLARPDLR